MKSIGVVRKVDGLGRIVLPKEIRRTFKILENETSLELYTVDDSIVLKKYEPSCVFCDEARDTVNYKGKVICKACFEEMKEF